MPIPTTSTTSIRAVLIDLSGTLHIGNDAIPGAREALKRLRSVAIGQQGEGKRRLAIRFLTNTSTKSVAQLLDQLNDECTLGFSVSADEMVTSIKATADYVREHCLNPLCLMEDTSDFLVQDNDRKNPKDTAKRQPRPSAPYIPGKQKPYDSVVVGLAPSQFYYEQLNRAFRVLLEHPSNLIAVHRGNFVRDVDRELSLGPGAFISALETASNCDPAKVMGKPSKAIFDSALRSINSGGQQKNDEGGNTEQKLDDGDSAIISAEEVCMIGDDVLVDCEGALKSGLGTAILVQTGKYRPGDEEKLTAEKQQSLPGVFLVCPSIVEAVDYILGSL